MSRVAKLGVAVAVAVTVAVAIPLSAQASSAVWIGSKTCGTAPAPYVYIYGTTSGPASHAHRSTTGAITYRNFNDAGATYHYSTANLRAESNSEITLGNGGLYYNNGSMNCDN